MVNRWSYFAVILSAWTVLVVNVSADGVLSEETAVDHHLTPSSIAPLELVAGMVSIDESLPPECPSPKGAEVSFNQSRLALTTQKNYSVFSIQFTDDDSSSNPDIPPTIVMEPTPLESADKLASLNNESKGEGNAVAVRLRLFNTPLTTDGSNIVLSSDLFLPVSWDDVRQYIWSLCLSSQKQWALNADIIVDQPPILVNGSEIQNRVDPQSLAFAAGMNYRFNEHILVEMTYFRLHWRDVDPLRSSPSDTLVDSEEIGEYAVAHLRIQF